ncbi:MAG: transglutaminase domain-containing protein [Spirochaetaceae bacterium]|nr:transglutaminase domain-containing protein [Spirochaetaceae bacterium]
MNVKRIHLKVIALLLSISIILNACATGEAAQGEAVQSQAGLSAAQYEQAIRNVREQNFNVLRGILKMHSTFRGTTENAGLKPRFDFDDENFSVLKAKYGLPAIAGTGGDLEKSLNILFWLCEHTCHVGDYDNHVPMNALDLLEYAYDTGAEQGLNCLNLSYILTECLLSLGIPVRWVGLMPFSPYDADNHVVTHVYIAELGKWIMLDPTWEAYFKDAEGNILDVVELRGFLADGREVFLNEEFSYNGTDLITNDDEVRWYKQYLAKDLFYFNTSETSGFGRDNSGRGLTVCPAGYSPFVSRMYGLEYRIEFARTYEGWDEAVRESYIASTTKQIENMRRLFEEDKDAAEEAYLYISLEDFLAKP